MESVLSHFDNENRKNFWKMFPSWKTPKIFNAFYKKDKSKAKEVSSDIMWAIAHMFDRSEWNPYKNLNYEDKIDVINDDVLESLQFDWKPYEQIIDSVREVMLSDEEKEYESFKIFMENRRRLIEIEEADMSLAKLKEIDEARKRNKINIDELSRLKDAVEQKMSKGKTKGDIIESALETGAI